MKIGIIGNGHIGKKNKLKSERDWKNLKGRAIVEEK